MPETSQRAGAVDVRCLVQLLGNALEAGDEDEHVVTEVLPDRHEDDRRHRPVGIAKPIDRSDADVAEQVIEEPVAWVVEIAPDDGDGDERRDKGREIDGAEESAESHGAGVDEERST